MNSREPSRNFKESWQSKDVRGLLPEYRDNNIILSVHLLDTKMETVRQFHQTDIRVYYTII